MQQIPVLFAPIGGDEDHVSDQIVQGLEWAREDGTVATRQWNGVPAYYHDGGWYIGVKLSENEEVPEGFIESSPGRGWVPAGNSEFDSALVSAIVRGGQIFSEGTYELCGPSIGGNPEKLAENTLIPHGIHCLPEFTGRTAVEVRNFLDMNPHMEGLVFYRTQYHGEEGMAKVKRSHFADLSPEQVQPHKAATVHLPSAE